MINFIEQAGLALGVMAAALLLFAGFIWILVKVCHHASKDIQL